MSLRSKIILLLFGVFCLYFMVDVVVRDHVVFKSFLETERGQAIKEVENCASVLRREVQVMSLICSEIANSSAARLAIGGGSTGPLRRRLAEASASNVNMVYLCKPDGSVLWSRTDDMGTNVSPELPDFAKQYLTSGVAPLRLSSTRSHIEGLMITGEGLAFVAVRPVYYMNDADRPPGMLVLGRLARDEDLQNMVKPFIGGAIRIWPMMSERIPMTERAIISRFGPQRTPQVLESGEDHLLVYMRLNDISGRPALLLRADIPRQISVKGRLAVQVAQLLMGTAGVTILALMWFAMQKLVVERVKTLTDFANAVRRTDDLSPRLEMRGNDEISTLAGEMDAMVASLAESRFRMLDAAHRAGMAEIATEVLHNVGNALNSVSVSSEVLGEQVDRLGAEGLRKATSLLMEHRDDMAAFMVTDPRGPRMLEYLTMLSDTMDQQHGQMQGEVQVLREKVVHIKEIIALQQTYASQGHFVQDEDLVGIVEDALRVHWEKLQRQGVHIVREYDHMETVQVNRAKLLQVLVNLVKNAQEAMDDVSPAQGEHHCLTLRVTHQKDDASMVLIQVADTGPGLTKQKCKEIFEFGFTTKITGHGFGLHFCANAMSEMGGTIIAESDGPGHGCTFTLTLPVHGVKPDASSDSID